MNALCGCDVQMTHLYFAYGSNLLEKEVKRHTTDAEFVGIAILPCYRLEFTKHSISRNGDAASIRKHEASTVWGCIYKISDKDKNELIKREEGYEVIPELIVYLHGDKSGTAEKVFTFDCKDVCPEKCGPSMEYRTIVLEGARSRHIPDRYIEEILDIPR